MKREIHKIYDIIMKIIIIMYLDEFLEYIGEERKIMEVLKTEFPTLNGKTRYLDFLCRLDDGSLCNIEFEFPVAYSDDLERFFDYNIVVQIDQDKLTETIVINFTESGYGSRNIKIGESKEFHPKNIYLGDIDYISELEKIKLKLNSKLSNKEELENINKNNKTNTILTSKEELHLLIMSLLPKYENKTELLLDISDILKNQEFFRKEKIGIIKEIIDLEIKNLIPKKDQCYFKGDDDMNQQEFSDLAINVAKEVNKKYEQIALDEAKEEGKKEGKKEGKEEGKKEIAKKLKEIHTPEEIAKITGLSLQTILLL